MSGRESRLAESKILGTEGALVRSTTGNSLAVLNWPTVITSLLFLAELNVSFTAVFSSNAP